MASSGQMECFRVTIAEIGFLPSPIIGKNVNVAVHFLKLYGSRLINSKDKR